MVVVFLMLAVCYGCGTGLDACPLSVAALQRPFQEGLIHRGADSTTSVFFFFFSKCIILMPIRLCPAVGAH